MIAPLANFITVPLDWFLRGWGGILLEHSSTNVAVSALAIVSLPVVVLGLFAAGILSADASRFVLFFSVCSPRGTIEAGVWVVPGVGCVTFPPRRQKQHYL